MICSFLSSCFGEFAQVFGGVRSPAEFFSEENVNRIFAAAGSA